MKGLYTNPVRASNILILLGLSFLVLSAVNLLILHASTSLDEVGKKSFQSNFPDKGGDYVALRRRAIWLEDQLDSERSARLKTLAAAMAAMGLLFILWGIDRQRMDGHRASAPDQGTDRKVSSATSKEN